MKKIRRLLDIFIHTMPQPRVRGYDRRFDNTRVVGTLAALDRLPRVIPILDESRLS